MRSGPLWGKKEAHCNADDKEQGWGDGWDHDILDVASRAVVAELKERLAPGHVPGLVTTDEHSPYVEAMLAVFGQSHTPERSPGPGAPKKAVLEPAPELVYAQVDKQRSASGRVEKVECRLIFGTPEQLQQRLEESSASTHVNTSFVERYNGFDRQRNPRKARKVLSFSKEQAAHRAVSWLVMVLGIFCWAPRTLRQSPAMVLGKAERVLTIGEYLRLRPQGFRPPRWEDIQGGRTPFHAPDVSPERLAHWPNKHLCRGRLNV